MPQPPLNFNPVLVLVIAPPTAEQPAAAGAEESWKKAMGLAEDLVDALSRPDRDWTQIAAWAREIAETAERES